MVEYEKRKVKQYLFIGVPKNLKMHWLHFLGWTMAKFIYAQVIDVIIAITYFANYVHCGPYM